MSRSPAIQATRLAPRFRGRIVSVEVVAKSGIGNRGRSVRIDIFEERLIASLEGGIGGSS